MELARMLPKEFWANSLSESSARKSQKDPRCSWDRPTASQNGIESDINRNRQQNSYDVHLLRINTSLLSKATSNTSIRMPPSSTSKVTLAPVGLSYRLNTGAAEPVFDWIKVPVIDPLNPGKRGVMKLPFC
jgi:hypothetical protein